MKESIKSIIYIIFGIAICVAALITDAATEITCLGAAITVMAIVSFVVTFRDERKKFKEIEEETKND